MVEALREGTIGRQILPFSSAHSTLISLPVLEEMVEAPGGSHAGRGVQVKPVAALVIVYDNTVN